MQDEYGREWRFWVKVNPHDETDKTIYRGRKYQTGEDNDRWSNYFDGGDHVAFYDEGYRGRRILDGADQENSSRAITIFEAERDGLPGAEGGLDRFAQRFCGDPDGTPNPDSRFIRVALDRGLDFYVMSWSGDPDGDWRDELEALWNGDVWRIECESLSLVQPDGSLDWQREDDVCEEYYGEDKAQAGFEEQFPLAEFPAELLVPEAGA